MVWLFPTPSSSSAGPPPSRPPPMNGTASAPQAEEAAATAPLSPRPPPVISSWWAAASGAPTGNAATFAALVGTGTSTRGTDKVGSSEEEDLDRKLKARDNNHKSDDGDDDDGKMPALSSSLSASTLEDRGRRLLLESIRNSTRVGATRSQKIWTDLPEQYQVDKDFVLAALKHLPVLPDKNHFERKFPQTLRFDRDVALAFCARNDFVNLYEQRHLYPPHCLTGDKEVMLAYCRKIPRSLQECSEELADDREVVEAAIALDGLELQYASRRLQEDQGVVRAACLRDGRALEFVPDGPLKVQLCHDREFMLEAVRQRGGSAWRLASDQLKMDRQLLLEALANGMRLRFCPALYQEDRGFLRDALERHSLLYLEMNRATQADPVVATAAVTSPTSTAEVHARALELVPSLQSNRDVLLAVALRGNADIVSNMFLEEANERFRGDKEIVLAVLAKRPSLFSTVSPSLRSDNDVLVAAMDENSALDILKTVSPTVQEENPEIPAHAIAVSSARNLRYVRGYVLPASLWGNRIVALAWIRRGQRIMLRFNPFLGDLEFALALAQYVPLDFPRVHADLRSDEAFMRQALALNGRVLRYANPDLQRNYSLIVRAVAAAPDALWPGSPVAREQVIEYLNDKLHLHRVFIGDFLRGIAIHPERGRVAPSRRSALPLLDRGVETSQAFKRLIAEFLGVPLGSELEHVRQAHANLINPPPASSATASAAAAIDPFDDFDDPWIGRGLWARRPPRLGIAIGFGGRGMEEDDDRLWPFMDDAAADDGGGFRALARHRARIPDRAPMDDQRREAARARLHARVRRDEARAMALRVEPVPEAPRAPPDLPEGNQMRRQRRHLLGLRLEFRRARRPDDALARARVVERENVLLRARNPIDPPAANAAPGAAALAADAVGAARPARAAEAMHDEDARMIARMIGQEDEELLMAAEEEEFYAAMMAHDDAGRGLDDDSDEDFLDAI